MNFLRRLHAVCMLQNRLHKSVQNLGHISQVSPLKVFWLSPCSCLEDMPVGWTYILYCWELLAGIVSIRGIDRWFIIEKQGNSYYIRLSIAYIKIFRIFKEAFPSLLYCAYKNFLFQPWIELIVFASNSHLSCSAFPILKGFENFYVFVLLKAILHLYQRLVS